MSPTTAAPSGATGPTVHDATSYQRLREHLGIATTDAHSVPTPAVMRAGDRLISTALLEGADCIVHNSVDWRALQEGSCGEHLATNLCGSLELLKLPGLFVVLEKGEPSGPSNGMGPGMRRWLRPSSINRRVIG